MGEQLIGIIGGTGMGDAFAAEYGGTPIDVETPFGPPSAPPLRTRCAGTEIVFLNRHGVGHRFAPSQVPYRANIFALKKLGVTTIIASGATGSLREEVEPGHLVVCDQVIDKTFRRPGTFFDDGVVAHVECAEPFCPRLRERLLAAAGKVDTRVHETGTYVCMEGPQFSTRAESLMHRQWGGDLIGMTCMPEAKLAREAEICYALIALPTDFDCWKPHASDDADALLSTILRNLQRATDQAVQLVRTCVQRLADAPVEACRCRDALKLAIWTDSKTIDPQTVHRLAPLIGRYFADAT